MATSKILFLYWKILGMCPFNITADGAIQLAYSGTIYGVILTVCYSYYYIRAIASHMNYVLPHKTPMSVICNFAGLSVEYASLVWTWLLFGLRLKSLRRILVVLKNINEDFENNGMSTDDIEIKSREVKIHAIILNIIWYSMCVISYELFFHFEPFKLSVWMPLLIPRGVSHNVILIFINALRLIKSRFRLLNERILRLSNEDTRKPNVLRENEKARLRNGRFQSLVDTTNPLETYANLHANLVHLMTIVVEFFSPLLLLVILFGIIQMSSGFYTLCVITQDEALKSWAFVWIFWVAAHVLEIITLAFVCESTVKEANRTGSVLHKMLIVGSTDKYMESATVLSLGLLQRKMTVEVYGLFEIKQVIITKITSVVIVYITIMMQLDSQDEE